MNDIRTGVTRWKKKIKINRARHRESILVKRKGERGGGRGRQTETEIYIEEGRVSLRLH